MKSEALLEPLLRKMRIKKLRTRINSLENTKLLDIGCGINAKLLFDLEPYIKQGYGIDKKCIEINTEKIITKRIFFEDGLPFDDETFDVVTALAVLEHVENEQKLMKDINRVLKSDGILMLTTPTKPAKKLLEFLAFKLGVVSKEEILDHKHYFSKNEIESLAITENMLVKEHKYFQFGFNQFCVLSKQASFPK